MLFQLIEVSWIFCQEKTLIIKQRQLIFKDASCRRIKSFLTQTQAEYIMLVTKLVFIASFLVFPTL